jgi:diaminopimelate epimerase
MKIPFVKAHGAMNDFLLTWKDHVPVGIDEREAAKAICQRHSGVGADGWMLVEKSAESNRARIRLYNSDGSDSEISGNGTRCVAAWLVTEGLADTEVIIETGAGKKHLRLLEKRANGELLFEMEMGGVEIEELEASFSVLGQDYFATILRVGNPQCGVLVDSLDFDWKSVGAVLERHPRFRQRSNVSFIKRVSDNAIEVRFFERGAGPTMSSGTGSTGAAMTAIARGIVKSPVEIVTEAGSLYLRVENDRPILTGPAIVTTQGTFEMR